MPFVTRINQLINRPAQNGEWWSVLITGFTGHTLSCKLTRRDANSSEKFAGSIHARGLVNGSEYDSIRAKFYSGVRRVIEFPEFIEPYDVRIQIPPWIAQVDAIVEEWIEDSPLIIQAQSFTDSSFVTVTNSLTATTGVTQLNTTLVYESPLLTLKEANVYAQIFGTGGGTTANVLMGVWWNTARLNFAIRRFEVNLPGSMELSTSLVLPSEESGKLQIRVSRLNSSQTFRVNSASSTANIQLFLGHSSTQLNVTRVR